MISFYSEDGIRQYLINDDGDKLAEVIGDSDTERSENIKRIQKEIPSSLEDALGWLADTSIDLDDLSAHISNLDTTLEDIRYNVEMLKKSLVSIK